MSNSPLVSYTKISPNKTSPRNHKIDTITIHCVVGQLSAESIGACFEPKDRKASSNYGIGTDGKIGMYVEEKDRSWCSSNASNDHRAITIECASDLEHPYAINDKVYASLIDLLVDICQRNEIPELRWKADKNLVGKPEEQNMTVHRWFANKACPGDYIYERLGKIAEEVNVRLANETTTVKEPEPEAKKDTSFLVRVAIPNLNIRTEPTVNSKTQGIFTGVGTFTIMEVVQGPGSKAGWGLLKSYQKARNGWISLDFTTKV